MYRCCKIILAIISICLILPLVVSAEIEIPISPLSAPIIVNGGGRSGFDEFGEENKVEKIKEEAKISKTKAVLLSLIIPGAGHYYVGHKERGQIFMGAEVVSWFGFFALLRR